jgi:signal transduction histidine kinase
MITIERFPQLFLNRIMLIAATVIWTLAVSSSLVWNIYQAKKTAVELSTNEAIVHLKKDMAFGMWSAKYGGVYLPVSDDIKPSPFLADLPERDIRTPSGRILTLTNPAYMLRSFFDDNGILPKDYSSVTSLKPLNPENEPDPWQKSALLSFDSGSADAFTIEEIEGKICIRYMKPVWTEKGCLRCHESQGYREGDIRGGISVSVPLYNYHDITNKEINRFYLTHGFIWMLGIVGIFRGWSGMQRHNEEKQRAYERLEKSEKQTRYLNSRLINVHEFERKRIAMEVHDEICQIIIASKFIIENAINKIDNNSYEDVKRHLDKAVSILQKVINKVRNLEKNLVPPLLKDLGLTATVLSFCREFERDYPDIKVKTNIDIDESEFTLNLKTTIFRIIQEAFTNIARHSCADAVNLMIVKSQGIIKLSVSDNGKGFETESIYEDPSPLKGMGIAGIKERTEFSGGLFEIRSGAGLGTILTCTWPSDLNV